jgi:hypothetical protein
MPTTNVFIGLAILAAAAGSVLTINDASAANPSLAVGPQYDTAHVYVAPEDFDRFIESLVATFDGTKSQVGVINVIPTPSQTIWQAVFTPAAPSQCLGSRLRVPSVMWLEFGVARSPVT